MPLASSLSLAPQGTVNSTSDGGVTDRARMSIVFPVLCYARLFRTDQVCGRIGERKFQASTHLFQDAVLTPVNGIDRERLGRRWIHAKVDQELHVALADDTTEGNIGDD